jgi:hypothetical protein
VDAKTRCRTIVTFVLAFFLSAVGTVMAEARPADWSSLPLPGDRAALCRVAGLAPRTHVSRLPFELVRILYGTPATAPPANPRVFAAVLDYLRTASDASAPQPEAIPSPLPPSAWREIVRPAPADNEHLFAAIMSSRRAALLFYGLGALDGETLDYLRGNTDLLRWIAEEHPGTLAACAAGLHATRDGVRLPGGHGVEPLWTALVGQPPTDADAFVRALFSRDLGKLACFFDTIASLDEPHRQFALGSDERTPKDRPRRFRALYTAFVQVDPTWSLENGPFTRRVDDGRMLLTTVDVTSNGGMAAPASNRLWNATFGQAPPAAEQSIDSAALATLVLDRDWRVRRQRLRTVLFAQRLFGLSPGMPTADLAAVLAGFMRFETLHLTLERMGITDLRTFSEAGARAAMLEDSTLLSQFQGALAVLDRCAFRGTVDLPARRRLVEALVAEPVDTATGYAGGIARWLNAVLLPELRQALNATADDSAEDLVLEALAGLVPPGASPLPTVRWEDRDYQIEEGAGELTRLLQVRRRQGGNRLDDVLSLEEQAAKLASGAGADASRILSLAGRIHDPELRSAGARRAPGEAVGAQLLDVGRSVDGGRRVSAETASRITAMADEMLGAVLRALAYAAHIGDPENNVLLGPSLADDHDFDLAEPAVPPIANGWALPYERMGGGAAWHVNGSLLCLDVILGRYSLPRSVTAPPGPRHVSRRDELALAHAAVLVRAADLSDAERDAIVAQIQKGRDRAHAAGRPSAAFALATDARIDPLRGNQLAWSVARGEALAAGLTLTDLWRIGGDGKNPTAGDAWGASSVGLAGCPFLRFPDGPPPDGYGWNASAAVGVAGVPDLSLRLAEVTAKLHVPAALVALLLPDATQELLDLAHPAHADDWMALASAAATLPDERRAEAIAAFTAVGGPLVPLPAAAKHD